MASLNIVGLPGFSSIATAVPGPGSTLASASGAVTASADHAAATPRDPELPTRRAMVPLVAAAAETDGMANVHALSAWSLSTIESPPAVVREVPAALATTGSGAALNVARQAALHDACFIQPVVAMPDSTVRIAISREVFLDTPGPVPFLPEATAPGDLVSWLAASRSHLTKRTATLQGTSTAAETATPDVWFAALGAPSSAPDAGATVGDDDLGGPTHRATDEPGHRNFPLEEKNAFIAGTFPTKNQRFGASVGGGFVVKGIV